MGSIYKRGKTWWIQFYSDGKAMRETSGSTKESDAKKLLKLREGDNARGMPYIPNTNRLRFKELLDDVETDYKINKKRSIEDLKRRIKLHIKPYFGHFRVVSI